MCVCGSGVRGRGLGRKGVRRWLRRGNVGKRWIGVIDGRRVGEWGGSWWTGKVGLRWKDVSMGEDLDGWVEENEK